MTGGTGVYGDGHAQTRTAAPYAAGQPPEGLRRRASAKGMHRGAPTPAGPGSGHGRMAAPAQPRMTRASSERLTEAPLPESIPSMSTIQPHAAQQLVLSGNIEGPESFNRAEADRRVSDLRNKLPSGHINWPQTLDHLDDVEGSHIHGNTYRVLADAAMRDYQRNRAPTGPSTAAAADPSLLGSDAQGRFTGHGYF